MESKRVLLMRGEGKEEEEEENKEESVEQERQVTLDE
jgi:hypothetical protein